MRETYRVERIHADNLVPLSPLVGEKAEPLGDGPRHARSPVLDLLTGEGLARDTAGVRVAGPGLRLAAVLLIIHELLQGDAVGDIL